MAWFRSPAANSESLLANDWVSSVQNARHTHPERLRIAVTTPAPASPKRSASGFVENFSQRRINRAASGKHVPNTGIGPSVSTHLIPGVMWGQSRYDEFGTRIAMTIPCGS